MRRSLGPPLCELHAHSSWSGAFDVSELVDLHGRAGFDVLCVTDHVVRSDDPWRTRKGLRFRSVDERSWEPYLAEVEREAARARRTYGMLVVPGSSSRTTTTTRPRPHTRSRSASEASSPSTTESWRR